VSQHNPDGSFITGNTNDTCFQKIVADCYSAVDLFFPACGLYDLTEGIYNGRSDMPYEQAQSNQINYLLDQIHVGPGSRVLDIGCGYGTLLEHVHRRVASGVGITISPEQRKHCQNKKLDVYLLNYKNIPTSWHGTFDGVVANGSLEHFVRPQDAAADLADTIYRRLFAEVHRLIDPRTSDGRFVTTAIHFIRPPTDALNVLKLPLKYRWGSDDFHWAILEKGWGGYYPLPGQLKRCAEGYFNLVGEVDGTEDYRITSEEWVRRVRRCFLSLRAISIAWRFVRLFIRFPLQFSTLMLSLLFSESWNWQFRPPNPPTCLLRQTWAYQPRH